MNQPAAPGGSYRIGAWTVARLGYGAMGLQRLHRDRRAAVAVLERAVALGINHLDTAEFYGAGFVNGVISEVLKRHPGLVVASKVGAEPNPEGPIPLRPAQRPEQLRASVEQNLKTLGVEQIPIVNLRRLDVGPGLAAEGEQRVDIDDQLAVMMAMRDEGKIGAVGLSAVDSTGLRRALPANIVCVQNAYSLTSRHFEDVLTLCCTEGIAWVPFFPLGGAFAGWPKVTDAKDVLDIAARLQVTPSQLALAWLLQSASNTLLIPGTASIAHLEENAAACRVTLDASTMAMLNAVAAPSQPVPRPHFKGQSGARVAPGDKST